MTRDPYTVFPTPLESPKEGARVAITDVADPLASSFGWHDTNGVAGPEFTDTRGNNVMVQEDADGDDVGGLPPSCGPGLDFDAPANLSTHPSVS